MSDLFTKLTGIIQETESAAKIAPDDTRAELDGIVEELVYLRLRVSMGIAK